MSKLSRLSIIFIFLCCWLIQACTNHSMTIMRQAQADYNRQNYTAVLANINKLALTGNPQAQYALGYMYFYGKGVPADQDLGRLWIQRAANQGYPPAIKAIQMLETPTTS